MSGYGAGRPLRRVLIAKQCGGWGNGQGGGGGGGGRGSEKGGETGDSYKDLFFFWTEARRTRGRKEDRLERRGEKASRPLLLSVAVLTSLESVWKERRALLKLDKGLVAASPV